MSEIGHDRLHLVQAPVIRLPEPRGGETRPEADLRIGLFGPIWFAWRGQEVRVGSRNARALIAVLVMERRPRVRDAIAADLWPDLPEAEAGSALRQALWLLKCGMAGAGLDAAAVVECDKDRIGLRADCAIELDVAHFETYMQAEPERVEEAIDLYRGDLAEGINLECLARDRERLADLFEDALAEASLRRMRDGDLAGARDAAFRLLRRDPLREEAHAVLIELYGLTGSRSQVTRQYRRLRGILASELNVEPLQETEAAYQVAMRRAVHRSELRTVWSTATEQVAGGASRN